MTNRRWTLPTETILLPVDQLKEGVRRSIEYEPGDYALSIPHSRLRTRILGGKAAALLEQFRKPRVIVEAFALEAVRTGVDAEALLREGFPLLKSFIDEGYLLPEHAAGIEPVKFSLDVGAQFKGYHIERTVALVADTEIYRLHTNDGHGAALKLSRRGGLDNIQRVFRREAAILEHLDGHIAPRLLSQGEWNERQFLIMEWAEGIGSEAAADRIRALPAAEQRPKFRALATSILQAYAELHACGVIHGDVHSNNIFINGEAARLIDFGIGRIPAAEGMVSRARRGGIEYYAAPEYVAARLRDEAPPQASFQSEQYSLGAVLYYLLTDLQYLEFSSEKEKIYREILEHKPLSLAVRRVEPWLALERVLRRALSKEPQKRFSTVAEFAQAVSRVDDTPATRVQQSNLRTGTGEKLLDGFLRQVEEDHALESEVFSKAPTCSTFYGAAGIAYTLYRVATVRSDPKLLATADIWCARAQHRQETEGAFYSGDRDFSRRNLGEVSFFHTSSGIELVEALLAASRGDVVTLQNACRGFVERVERPSRSLELTLGRASTLLGCALMIDAMAESEIRDDSIYRLGNRIFADLMQCLANLPPIPECRQMSRLGAAHGWAGILYALLLWRRFSAAVSVNGLEERLEELAALAVPVDDGVRWPRRLGQSVEQDYFAGWCNGSAGYVALWLLAARCWNNETWQDLARRAALDAWTDPHDLSGDLCCGYAGRAYALLSYYRFSGDREWLDRAGDLAGRAVDRIGKRPIRQSSLFKGVPGVALLTTDLACPEAAAMPLFEPIFS